MTLPSIITFMCALALPVYADVYPVTVPSGFFAGPQSGIGSWYRANAASDSTSGRSWCGYDYYNSDPLFAVVRTTANLGLIVLAGSD